MNAEEDEKVLSGKCERLAAGKRNWLSAREQSLQIQGPGKVAQRCLAVKLNVKIARFLVVGELAGSQFAGNDTISECLVLQGRNGNRGPSTPDAPRRSRDAAR